MAALTESLEKAGQRAESADQELNRLETDLGESCRRLGEAEAALRESQERWAVTVVHWLTNCRVLVFVQYLMSADVHTMRYAICCR